MPKRMLDLLRQPSLRLTIIGIVLLVLVPTLGVVMATLFNTSKSFNEASTRQLLETARTVARSTANELELTSSVLLNLAELHSAGEQLEHRGASSFANGRYELYEVSGKQGSWQFVGGGPEEQVVKDLTIAAAQSGRPQVSNIIESAGKAGGLQVVLAVPEISGSARVRVATLITSPADLIHSLSKHSENNLSVILAVTDGSGRIMGRSVDGQRFIGKPVPDWKALKQLGSESGSFKAQTLEGKQIMFAFQAIAGTPGWVAVVGESASSFDQRWRQPMMVMLITSTVTILCALLLAIWLVQRALRPIRHLADRAQRIATGHAAAEQSIDDDVPPSFIAEFEALRVSLDKADKVLHKSLEESRSAARLAQENNEVLRAAERQAKLGHWSLDVKTGVLTSSEMLSTLYGIEAEPDGIPLHTLGTRLLPESAQRIEAAVENCVATGVPYAMEVEHLRVDGSTFSAYVRANPVFDDHGEVVKIIGVLQDISERKEQRDRLIALADNLPSGVIFRMERDSRRYLSLTFLSAGLEKLTGLSASEVLLNPRKLIAALPAESVQHLMQLLRYADRPGEVLDEVFPLHITSGAVIWIHCRAALRYMRGGGVVWDGIARDVTTEREVADALRAAKDSAESAERAKSDFLATMSHEIRTPMNSVIGMARLAMRTNLDPRQRNYLEKINESANVLLGIINDILDFSKIEAGGLTLEGIPFRLESVLETVSSVTALRAEEKGLEITYAVAPETPAVIKGDSLRLGQVITNLLGNAIKFTEHGDVVVSVSPVWDEQGLSRKLLFSIRDTGIGMSADQIQSLFSPFAQAQTDISRRYGGTGLGLAISKRLVELMGGEIWVESEVGLGSTFFFTILIEEVAVESAEHHVRNQVAVNLRGRRILICDDSASARQALTDMVEGFGMQTTVVASGQDALRVLRIETSRGRPFDVVLLDWRMPVMDGVETARHIKSDAQLEHMPAVLMVTAYGQEAMMQASSDIGLQGVLLKPVTQSVLFNTLLNVFCRPVSAGDLPVKSSSAYVPSDLTAYAALQGKRVLVADDNALNREVATDFLEYVGVQVVTAVDGRDAIRQLQNHEVDAVLMDIHMPEMNGLEATREIRRHARWLQLPIIALTAQTRSEDQLLSREAGMNGHLTKPIEEVALYSTLMQWCVDKSKVVADESPRRTADEAPADAAVFSRLSSSPQRKANLLRGFLDDFNNLPQDYRDLLRRGALPELAELVHRIKGSAGYLDSEQLCRVADVIERAARNANIEVVQDLSEEFLRLVKDCLDRVDQGLQMLASQTAAPEPGPAQAELLQDLLQRALPLVKSGDFEAKALLEALVRDTANTDHSQLAQQALDAFDDLEIEQAAELLMQLRSRLG